MKHFFYIGLIASIIMTFTVSETFTQNRTRRPHYAQNVKHKKVKRAHLKHKKYTKLPKWGTHVSKVHAKAKVLKYRNRSYYFHSGVYYQKINKKYKIVRAPIGIRVAILPTAASRIVVKTKPYFYYYGTFYVKQKDNTYETINPPIGAKVEILPDGLEEVTINYETLYKLENLYFKPELTKEGQLVYEVIKAE